MYFYFQTTISKFIRAFYVNSRNQMIEWIIPIVLYEF